MKKYGKHTILGWGWRIFLWVALTPFALFLLAAIIIYLPPVQKWAVDKACDVLSEEMNMKVTVDNVRLKFPLDLSMGGMLAIQEGDTVIDARELDVSVRALPLFELKAEVDAVHLYDAKIYTKEFVDACVIKGRISELSLDSHSTDLKEELAVVNKALLRDADLFVMLADSVPEDTTESEPQTWKIRLDDVELQNVKTTVLLTPQADSTYAYADINSAHASAFIDLGEEIYKVDKLQIKESSARYELRKQPRLSLTNPNVLDPNHLFFKDVNLSIDSLCYLGTGELALDISTFHAKEQSGLHIKEARGRVEMDSLSLTVPKMKVMTDDSSVSLSYRMDMNAFDDVAPGAFSVLAEGQIGKGDIIYFTRMGGESTKDVCQMMNQQLPAQPVQMQMKAKGNLQTLDVEKMYFKVPGMLTADGKAMLWDVAGDDLSLQATLNGDFGNSSTVNIDGSYVMASEAYKVDAIFKNVLLNKFVDISDRTVLSGNIQADGKGFDFYAPSTVMNATAHLDESRMGKIDLSNIDADAQFKGGKLVLDLLCNNKQITTDLTLDAQINKNLIAGILDIDLSNVDVQSMGFSDDVLTARTSGVFDFSYNFDKLFHIDSNIDALSLVLGKDSIVTDEFHLLAEAQKDSTIAVVRTGDLSFDFCAPENMFKLQPQLDKFLRVATRQFKERKVNLDYLKTYLPDATFHVTAGEHNPVSDVLRTFGYSFREFFANVDVSPETGIDGKGHVYSFMTDSIKVDSAFFIVSQDSSKLDFKAGVKCKEQPQLPAFTATLDGYLMADKADAHLKYYDKEGKKGIDLGLFAHANDSCVNMNLYPERPIIAYREFAINEENFIRLRPNKPIEADIRLKSTADSCAIELYANDTDSRQTAEVAFTSLNIEKLLAVIPVPGLPSMSGMLEGYAEYAETDDNFLVEGQLCTEKFKYEGMDVGMVSAAYSYVPQGQTKHSVNAVIGYNRDKIATVSGTYDSEGEGNVDARLLLAHIPMSLVSPFVPDQLVQFSGNLDGDLAVTGPLDDFRINGALQPSDVHVMSNQYSIDLALANDFIAFNNSRIDFNQFSFYAAEDKEQTNPLSLNGYVDFANLDEIFMSLSLRGKNFKLVDSKRTAKKVLFGEMYGDFFTRVIGSTKDLTVRGLVRVLPTTNATYIMSETPLYQGDRLEDIVTFVDFSAPPPPLDEIEVKSFMGIDMNLSLVVEDGALLRAELSADGESYVNVQGGGTLTMSYTPEGVFNLQGRYTINEGDMKYTMPVIPLRVFTIHSGSYIEFTGAPANPILNITATERVKTTVGASDGTSRSVAFDTGLKISNTLENMQIQFVIDAPEDVNVQNELAGFSPEEKNKLAVALIATGLYVSDTNSRGVTAGNALNNFLQNEINNIAGQALSTMVDVNVGMSQTTRDDGTKRTDYSFQFSRRFFSDRLNVVVGGKVSADGNKTNNESGAYIDDVSLEWRLDNGGTQYIRLFHEKDYTNLVEGEVDKNGVGLLLKKKVDKLSDLMIWKKKKEEPVTESNNRNSDATEPRRESESTQRESFDNKKNER
ncbi:MAG: translocation/assembly module TamB domain-containing protein [Prevotellaceae bacterium]|nr:translocation/assembly module TamB domain-containing protein [Candidatus Minthosoma equi]